MPNLPDTGALFRPSLDQKCKSYSSELAVKLVHGPVQAIQCSESNGEHDTVDGKDHQKNVEAVGHGAPLLTTDKAAGGRKRSRPPRTQAPGWRPPWRRPEHPLPP